MSVNNTAVQFDHVSYTIENKTLLNNLNFEIYQGEILVLLGRSGSGKTTTLKLVNHLLAPTQGQVLVEGKSTNTWHPIELRRHIGYVIQDVGLFPHFTVAENVGLVPSLLGWKPYQLKTRVHELLHTVGLPPEEFGSRYPDQLSGGQKQRVGVARALAADPPILLMDEPFAALDPITRRDLQQQLRSLQTQFDKTIIFVTHDIQEAMFLADRIGLMYQGDLITLAEPSALFDCDHPETKQFLACLNWQSSSL